MSIRTAGATACIAFVLGSGLTLGLSGLVHAATYDHIVSSLHGAGREPIGLVPAPNGAEGPATPEADVFDFHDASEEEAVRMITEIARLQEAGADITFR